MDGLDGRGSAEGEGELGGRHVDYLLIFYVFMCWFYIGAEN